MKKALKISGLNNKLKCTGLNLADGGEFKFIMRHINKWQT